MTVHLAAYAGAISVPACDAALSEDDSIVAEREAEQVTCPDCATVLVARVLGS